MKKRAILAYLILLAAAFLTRAFSHAAFDYLLPLYLLAVPVLLRGKVNISFRMKDLAYGLGASGLILIPFYLLFPAGRQPQPVNADFILIQLFVICLPEEAFFRGYLQDILGNSFKGILLVSAMFAATHLPGLIFYNDAYALLTFFPSLVMGFLYLKTRNILAPVIFHFLANLVFRIL